MIYHPQISDRSTMKSLYYKLGDLPMASKDASPSIIEDSTRELDHVVVICACDCMLCRTDGPVMALMGVSEIHLSIVY